MTNLVTISVPVPHERTLRGTQELIIDVRLPLTVLRGSTPTECRLDTPTGKYRVLLSADDLLARIDEARELVK